LVAGAEFNDLIKATRERAGGAERAAARQPDDLTEAEDPGEPDTGQIPSPLPCIPSLLSPHPLPATPTVDVECLSGHIRPRTVGSWATGVSREGKAMPQKPTASPLRRKACILDELF